MGIQEERKDLKHNTREAIRAVIIKENKILMVHNDKGDFKFPGGGAEKGEDPEATLRREVREETGYILDTVDDKIGQVIERSFDEYEENCIFEMTSSYYLCKVTNTITSQQLDDYEADLNFQAVWVTFEEAISSNEKIINEHSGNMNHWVYRETTVLKDLKKYLDK